MASDTLPLHRVLLVDDDPDIHDLVRVALGDGLELHVCETGAAAVATARAVRPDLILLDYMMPDLDGRAVLERLRAAPDLRAVPIVFLTALGGRSDRAQLAELGADAVLAKPFDPRTLRAELERLASHVHG
jgi:two-component system OmpR family response regulator